MNFIHNNVRYIKQMYSVPRFQFLFICDLCVIHTSLGFMSLHILEVFEVIKFKQLTYISCIYAYIRRTFQ